MGILLQKKGANIAYDITHELIQKIGNLEFKVLSIDPPPNHEGIKKDFDTIMGELNEVRNWLYALKE